MPEALYRQQSEQQDYTALAAILAGFVFRMPDGRAAVLRSDLAIGQKGCIHTQGIIDFTSASGTLFADGEDVWWDDTNNLAVKTGAATATFLLGTSVGAKINGAVLARVELNSNSMGNAIPLVKAVSDSAAVSNTTTETIVGTFTIPANFLKTGTILEFIAAMIATATNLTDTFQLRVRMGGIGGTVIADSTAIDLANNDVGVAKGQLIVRADGVSGTWAAASQSQMKTASNPVIANGSVDTTVGTVTLVVTITESVANAGNSAVLREFNVFKR